MSEKLKPCPFCGTEPFLIFEAYRENPEREFAIQWADAAKDLIVNHGFYPDVISCPNCGHSMEVHEDFFKAVADWNSWNRRAEKMKGKLKPCPFCGSEAKLKGGGGKEYYVTCVNAYCNVVVETYSCKSKKRAIAIWNRRYEEND